MADVRRELTLLHAELMAPAEAVPEDVAAERLREVWLEEAEVREREHDGRPPAQEPPRS